MDPVWKPFCCGECGKKFTAIEMLKKHLKEEHPIDEKQKLINELMKMNENLENQNIGLEMEVKASQKIIARVKGETEHFKKGKNVADKVIKNLQEKLNDQSREISDAEQENEKLREEIKVLETKLSKFKQKKVKEKNLQTDDIKVEEKNLQTDALMVEEKNLQTDALMVDEKSLQTECFNRLECRVLSNILRNDLDGSLPFAHSFY